VFDMRQVKILAMAALATVSALSVHAQQRDTLAWAPVPSSANGWVAPNKPHTKIADLLAAHKNVQA